MISSIDFIRNFLNMLITTFIQLLQKSHPTSKTQQTSSEKIIEYTLFQTASTLRLVIKSLYTNIPNAEVIKPTKIYLEKYSIVTTATKVITTFSALILTLNYFIFNCRNYLQTKCCAMYNNKQYGHQHMQTFLLIISTGNSDTFYQCIFPYILKIYIQSII